MHAKFFTPRPDYAEKRYVIKKFKYTSHPCFYFIEIISFVPRNEEIGIELECENSFYANSLGHKILHMRHMLDNGE